MEKFSVQHELEERSKKVWEKTALWKPRSMKEQSRCSRHWSRDSPLAHDEVGCPPAVYGQPWWSMWNHLKELVTCGKLMLEQTSTRTCGPVERSTHCTALKGPVFEKFMKKCSLWEGPTLEKSTEDSLLWEGSSAGAEMKVRRKKWKRQCVMNWLQHLLLIQRATQREEIDKSISKLSLGRREGWGEVVLRSGLIFLLSYSDLTCNKLS